MARITKTRSYLRKTDRPYHYLTAAQLAAIIEWAQARDALGSQKTIAHRVGVSVNRVQAVIKKMRQQQYELKRSAL